MQSFLCFPSRLYYEMAVLCDALSDYNQPVPVLQLNRIEAKRYINRTYELFHRNDSGSTCNDHKEVKI